MSPQRKSLKGDSQSCTDVVAITPTFETKQGQDKIAWCSEVYRVCQKAGFTYMAMPLPNWSVKAMLGKISPVLKHF